MANSPIVTEQGLARTYDDGHYDDAWEIVEQYRRAVSYAFRHDAGSSATASALDLPRGRLRSWIDSRSAPQPVRAIDTAREHGWLECEFNDESFRGLNILVANVFSGGSIKTLDYAPSFALSGPHATVIDGLELAKVDYDLLERDGRADEARPTTDATVLGRVLTTLGAPVGSKTEQELSLPSYLDEAPGYIRSEFVDAYLENRAIGREGSDVLTIREERNRDYLESLRELFEDVSGESVRLGERDIIITADAARSLGPVR